MRKSWRADLIESKQTLLLFRGVFEEDVLHGDLGLVRQGTISYEYYWTDRWFNVFKFLEPDGRFRNFYCNIILPPNFSEGTLDYIDLDLDILVDRTWNATVLDTEEFAENTKKFSYPREVIDTAWEQVEVLRRMIADREFPFELGENTMQSNHCE